MDPSYLSIAYICTAHMKRTVKRTVNVPNLKPAKKDFTNLPNFVPKSISRYLNSIRMEHGEIQTEIYSGLRDHLEYLKDNSLYHEQPLAGNGQLQSYTRRQ